MRALIVVALLLAGCAAPADDVVVEPLPEPVMLEDVEIQASGTMADGVSEGWHFTVDPSYTRFDASVCITGPNGGDFFLMQDYTIGLQNQNGTGEVWEGSGNSIRTGSPACLEYAATRPGDANVTGEWYVIVDAAPSAAEYTVSVNVRYGY